MTLAEALDRWSADTGSARWSPAGRFAHGEVGATAITSADGEVAVAKWWWPDDGAAGLGETVALCHRLRERGVPVPEYRFVGAIGGGVLAVCERLPGHSREVVGDALVDALLACNERQAGLVAAGHGWRGHLLRSLRDGLDGYCEHTSLRAHSDRARALLARVRAAGDRLGAVEERDAVHGDLHHLNVLQDDGRLTGIVDCEGMRSGDRVFDLVTLAFTLPEAECSPDAPDRVWRCAATLRPPEVLAAYTAHIALRQVDWSIRHRTEADVQRWLGRSEAALSRF